MTPVNPWLERLLHQALIEYSTLRTTHLDPNQTRRTTNFTFTEGNSSVLIVPLNNVDVQLVVEQLYDGGHPRIQRGIASDGTHSLAFACTKPDGKNYQEREILKVHNLGFRILLYEEIPRAVLSLRQHTLYDSVDFYPNPQVTELHTTPLSKKLLEHFREILGLSVTGGHTSPQSVHMFDSDSPIFQSRLQTQVEYVSKHKKQDSDGRSATGSPSAGRMRHLLDDKHLKMLELLKAPPVDPNTKLDFEDRKRSDSTQEKDPEAAKTPAKISAHNDDARSSKKQVPNATSQTPPLAERTKVHLLSDLLSPSPPQIGTHKACTEEPVMRAADTIVQLPPVMQARFRRWRSEAMNGRHITRGATRIQKDQAKILDDDASYQPARPGRDTKPGSIPIQLLQRKTEQANAAAQEPSEERSQANKNAPKARRGSACTPQTSQRDHQEHIDQLDSSQEVGSSLWSASPAPERRPQQPPDSSPPEQIMLHNSPAERIQRDDGETSPIQDQHRTVHGDNTGDSDEESASSEESANDLASSVRPETNILSHDPANAADRVRLPDGDMEDGGSLASQEHQKSTANTMSSTQIQVKRTPYPGKLADSGDAKPLPPDDTVYIKSFHAPNSSYIPCTYDDKGVRPLQPPIKDPSKDTAELGIMPMTEQPWEEQISPRPSKRHVVDGKLPPDAKRAKMSRPSPKSTKTANPYAAVDERIRKIRRAELGEIGRRKLIQATRPSSSDSSVPSQTDDNSILAPSHPPISSTKVQPVGQQVVTPFTSPSVRLNVGSIGSKKLRSSAIDQRHSSSAIPDSLFDDFTDEYPDYEGNLTQFEAACSALRKVLAQTGLNAFLFDDFVFHHYHSYIPYVRTALETGEDPVPCLKFFNETVEPSHLRRVLKQGSFGQPSTTTTSEVGVSETSRRAYKQAPVSSGQVGSVADIPRYARQLSERRSTQPHPTSRQTEASIAETHHEIDTAKEDGKKAEGIEQEASEGAHGQPIEASQKSSIETWLDQTEETAPVARVPSPELGTPEYLRPVKAVGDFALGKTGSDSPQQAQSKPSAEPKASRRSLPWAEPAPAVRPLQAPVQRLSPPRSPRDKKEAKARLSASPFVSSSPNPAANGVMKPKSNSRRSRDGRTPFQKWYDNMTKLSSEKTALIQLAAEQRVLKSSGRGSSEESGEKRKEHVRFYQSIDITRWRN